MLQYTACEIFHDAFEHSRYTLIDRIRFYSTQRATWPIAVTFSLEPSFSLSPELRFAGYYAT